MAVTPTNLRVTDTKTTTVDLAWDAATDATGYKVYRDTVLVATLGNVLTYQDTGRTPSTTYSYTVSSVDSLGAESAQSAPVTATTDDTSRKGSALQAELNRLANGGKYRSQSQTVGHVLAANQWAGTTNLDLQGALNTKAGNARANWVAPTKALNQIAGTAGLAIEEAARRCV